LANIGLSLRHSSSKARISRWRNGYLTAAAPTSLIQYQFGDRTLTSRDVPPGIALGAPFGNPEQLLISVQDNLPAPAPVLLNFTGNITWTEVMKVNTSAYPAKALYGSTLAPKMFPWPVASASSRRGFLDGATFALRQDGLTDSLNAPKVDSLRWNGFRDVNPIDFSIINYDRNYMEYHAIHKENYFISIHDDHTAVTPPYYLQGQRTGTPLSFTSTLYPCARVPDRSTIMAQCGTVAYVLGLASNFADCCPLEIDTVYVFPMADSQLTITLV
jgi:hypothetical protein